MGLVESLFLSISLPESPCQELVYLEVFIRNESFDVFFELLDVIFPSAELRDSTKSVFVGLLVIKRNLAKFVIVENDNLIPGLERLVRVRRNTISGTEEKENKEE